MSTKTDYDPQSDIDRKVEAGHGAYVTAGLDQLEAHANDSANHGNPSDATSLGEAEGKPINGLQDRENAINFTGTGSDTKGAKRFEKALNFTRKRGGIIGAVSAVAIGGGIMAGFFGPASLLINLTQNFSFTNDSSSTVMERRLAKVFRNATMNAGESSVCASTKKSMKCKMGKISNKALRQLSKKGIVAIDAEGKPIKPGRVGYPTGGNPSSYRFPGVADPIPASQLNDFLSKSENRKFAAQIMGRKGAFNMRVKAWTGKHITNKLYQKFGIERKGGAATGQNRTGTVAERAAQAKSRTMSSANMSDAQRSQAAAKAAGKATAATKKAGRGGVGYLLAVASCVAVKAPSIIAAGVAAIQLAQLMPVAMDLAMSPGDKATASGVDKANSITQEDAEALGHVFTNKTENSEGKMSSALDSKYLQAGMGVNKSPVPLATHIVPGLSLFTPGSVTAGIIQASRTADAHMAPFCNFIMTPAAMYSAMALDMAVTVAASATVVGGILKILVSWAVMKIAVSVTKDFVQDKAMEILESIAENDFYEKAEGEDLGDVVGHSAVAIFAAASMARHIPANTQAGVTAFNQIQQENEAFHREMDIASLSPFDTSSRHTFMGNIMFNLRTSMIVNGNYNNNPMSILSNTLSLPSFAFSPNTSASTGLSSTVCSYGPDFYSMMDGQDKEEYDTPGAVALTMTGLPCAGITPSQDRMETAEAIHLLQQEGWLCDEENEDCPEIQDGMTIDDLMPNTTDSDECQGYSDEEVGSSGGNDSMCTRGNGYIREDNPLYDFIVNCSNADTGDYIFNSGSCITIEANSLGGSDAVCGDSGVRNNDYTTGTETEGEGDDAVTTGGNHACSGEAIEDAPEVENLQDVRSLLAIGVFLIDYQILQSINGEDEAEGSGSGGTVAGELVGDKAYPLPKGSAPANTYANHGGVDFPVGKDTPIFSVADGVVEAVVSSCVAEHQGKGARCEGTGWGNFVRVRHSGSVDTLYAHMVYGSVSVKQGEIVKAGQQIGGVGSTGSSTGYHLHFEVYENGGRLGDTGAFNWLKHYNILPIDQDSLNW